MTSANFVDFQTSTTQWADSYAIELWKVYDTWNTKWATQPSVDNLMAMVVSERKVTGKRLLLARVLADPKALMDSNYVDALAVNSQLAFDKSFPLVYGDLGNSFYLSALSSKCVG
jgi:hypothetical protein